MRQRFLPFFAGLVCALSLALTGCGLDGAPTSPDTDSADLLASTAIDGERMAITFFSVTPAGKTLGSKGSKEEKEAEKEAKKAEKEAKKAEKEAEKEAKKAAREAEKEAAKADREAEREARKADREDDDAEQNDEDGGTVVESSSATVSALIGPEGGKLQFVDRGDRGGHDDLTVKFIVPEGSLAEPTLITMEVVGRTLSTLAIYCQPTGTGFDPPAKLQIRLGKDLVDLPLGGLLVAHTPSDGDTVPMEPDVEQRNSVFKIEVEVLGFSRYSLGH